MLLAGGCANDTGACSFADPVLAAAVTAQANGKHVAETELTDLTADGVTDLQGIGCLSRLQSLTVKGQLSDVSPVGQLKALLSLSLSSPQLRQLGGLAGAERLIFLDLQDSPIDTFEGIVGAPALATIWARGARSTLGLEDLPALTEMSLGYSPVTSLAGLQRTPLLRSLYLEFSRLSSFVGLGEQPGLTHIHASGTALASLEGLAAAPNLEEPRSTACSGFPTSTSLRRTSRIFLR
jgi:Leucine-rich repeat (LRR) protein